MSNAPDPQQIKSFLSNKASYADAEVVHTWLEGNPAELDKVILTENLEDSELVNLPETVKKRVLKRVLGRGVATMASIRKWMAAASIIGLILVWIVLFRNGEKEQKPVATNINPNLK